MSLVKKTSIVNGHRSRTPIRTTGSLHHAHLMRHNVRLVLLLLCIFASVSPFRAQAQCVGGNLTFVKTSGTRLDPHQSQLQVLKSQAGQVVLPDCIDLCKMNIDCRVFNMDYSMYMCTSIATNEARQESLTIIPTSSVFEKICLDEVTEYEVLCKNRMWAFERVIGLSMVGYRDRTETNVLNRSVCGKLCLLENNFSCRSVQYDSMTRTCILSREDRRTQPAAFVPTSNRNVDYLENQCAPAPIANCVYETREDVTAMSTEDVRQSFDEQECQTNCENPVFFSCRSYTFIPNQRKCYLSADDSVSLSENVANRSDTLKSFYGERKCTGNECTDGIIAFVKVTGHELRSANQEQLMTGAMGNTAQCLARCRDEGNKCPSLVMSYATDVCSKLDRNSQYRDNDLVPAPNGGVNFFDTVCLRGNTHACSNKLWAFERVPNHELRGFDEYVLPNVLSLRDCMEACVLETTFQCRSAEYDYDRVHCTLSTESRRSQWTYFVSTPKNVDYLENQCVEDSDFLCNYVQQGSAVPRYVDLVVPNIDSAQDCQSACNLQSDFECHSLGYRSATLECMLSGDDQISGGNVAMVPSSGVAYYQKECSRSSQINNMTTTEPMFDDTTTMTSSEPPSSSSESPSEPPDISSSASGSDVSPVTVPFPVTPPTEEPLTLDPPEPPTTEPGPGPMPTTEPTMGTLGPPASTSGRCKDNRGRIEFEKTTGYTFSNELELLHDGGATVMGISYECTVKCNADETCQGFVLDYVNNKCYSVKEPGSSVRFLTKALSTSYYEPVCYRSATGCGKLWTFERFPQNQLNVIASSTLRGISKPECQESCLMERGFLCRSVNYDASNMICHLNADDRFTRSSSLVTSTAYDYFENQCYQTTYISPGFIFVNRDNSPRIEHDFPPSPPRPNYGVDPRTSKGGVRGRVDPRGACYFVNDAPNSLLTYVEKEKMVGNEVDCQRNCDAEIQFNCHSYTYFILGRAGYGNGHCYISADTRNSLGAELKVQAGASYVERICSESLLRPEIANSQPPLPPPPPWPPFPPQLPPPPYSYPTYSPYPNNYPVYSGPPPPPPPPFRPNPPAPYQPFQQPYAQPPPTYLDAESQNQYLTAKEPLNFLSGDGGQVFPLPGPTSSNVGTSTCSSNADVTFERVTHLASQGTGSEVRISLLLSPTLDCLRECVAFGDKCQSVTFRTTFNGYAAPCTVYELAAGGAMTPPITSSDAAYFQKICIKGQKCGKSWTIDRVPYHVLEGYDDLELRNINSRDECATACVLQTAFQCRSAEFYFSQAICRLSQETRRLQPLSFRFYGDGVEYLENKCNPEPGFCDFSDFSNKFLPYFDRRLLGVPNLYDCKLSCTRESGFTCHSIAYDEQTRECYLSSCDRFCGYPIVDRPLTVYSERQACEDPTSLRLQASPHQPFDYPLLQKPSSSSSSSMAVTSKYNSQSTCDLSQQIGFERTTGYAPFSVYQELLQTSRVRGITEECVIECSSMGSRCQAFVLLYMPPPTPPKCVVYSQLSNTETAPEESKNKPEVAYFEKMCLTDQPCNKLWAFERVFGYEMAAGFSSSLEAVESRRECENLCLKSVNFLCRSAVYSRQIRTCRLHVESRHTSPAGYLFVGGDAQYLENQCVI